MWPPKKQTRIRNPKGQQPRNVPSGAGFGSVLTHNGGKDEDAGEKVGNHKQIFQIILRRRCLANCRQRQRGPIEAVDILTLQRIVACAIQIVDPTIGTEADLVADGKVHAGIPMYQHQDGQHHLADAKGVGVTRCGLSAIEPFPETGQTQQSIEAHYHRTRQIQTGTCLRGPPDVGEVCGQHRQHVQIPTLGVEVMATQSKRIADQQTLIQITCEGRSRRYGLVVGTVWVACPLVIVLHATYHMQLARHFTVRGAFAARTM